MSRYSDLSAENERLIGLLRHAGIDPELPAASEQAFAAPDQEDYSRHLLEAMSEGFYVVDPSGVTTVCNTAMVRLLGFDDASELLGTSLHEIAHHSHADGSHYPAVECPIYRAAREGVSATVTGEVFFRRDGSSFPVEYRAEPVMRGGRVTGAVCTFIDITDRLEAERQLKASEHRLALAMEAGGIGIWDYSPPTGQLRWDDRVRALFGLAPEVEVTMDAALAAVHPADRADVEQAMRSAFDPAGAGAYDASFRAVRLDDGAERWIAAKGQTTFRNGEPERFIGVMRDISDEKTSERHLRLMMNELNHRVKNSLAMAQALAAQTLRGATDLEVARTAFTERLVALARAHDVLTATRWEGADLGRLVELSMEPILDPGTLRLTIGGPPVALSPKAALAFSLALHELATNALKYGALSNPTGAVSIRWSAEGPNDARRLLFTWQERGGPAVVLPQRRGFGSKLIERGLASELQGDVRIDFRREGIVCRVDAPYPIIAVRSLSP